MPEILVALVGLIFTGGMGWWAHYVTSGAAKAHFLAREVELVKHAMEDRQEREDEMFRNLHAEVDKVQEHLVGVAGGVQELHGKVDVLLRRMTRRRTDLVDQEDS